MTVALAFLEAAGPVLVIRALGYSVDFRVEWLPLMRLTAGSSVGRCLSGVALRLMIASTCCVLYMFSSPTEPVHDRLGARDSDLQNVLAVHKESNVDDATTTARSTLSGGLTRCDWAGTRAYLSAWVDFVN